MLARLSKFMNFQQKRILMKTFVEISLDIVHSSGCFITWKVNSKINRLQERFLRIVYNDYITLFEDLLKKGSSFKIYQEKIQSLAMELFKVEKGIANPILCDIFTLRSIDHNLRSQTDFSVRSVNTTHFGFNTLRYFASKIWNMVHMIEMFKFEIRKPRKPRQCESALCRSCVHSIRYVNISNN